MSQIYYRETGKEKLIFEKALEHRLPVLLKGPTGCGKSRFVEYMTDILKIPLVKVSCNEDTSASDLLGRFLLRGNETVWQDGPVTKAVRHGHLLYLDEVAEAREDVVVVLHSLSDHRRELTLDRTNEVIKAPSSFMLIASFNPGYQGKFKEMKPSTRQRFLTLPFTYPHEGVEAEIIEKESACSAVLASKLAKVAKKIRTLTELGLRETVSTRLLINAAILMVSDIEARTACDFAITQSLTDDTDIARALNDLFSLTF